MGRCGSEPASTPEQFGVSGAEEFGYFFSLQDPTMLTKTEKRALRGRLFRHLDGVVITPTAHTLWQHQVPQTLLEEAPITLTQLAKQTGGNKGYLNVALRLLCSQEHGSCRSCQPWRRGWFPPKSFG